jgi:hypothetical protein
LGGLQTFNQSKMIIPHHTACHLWEAARKKGATEPGKGNLFKKIANGCKALGKSLDKDYYLSESTLRTLEKAVKRKPIEQVLMSLRTIEILCKYAGMPMEEMLPPPPPARPSGLCGNWYVYHHEADGTIRRGKIRVNEGLDFDYVGTRHSFRGGTVKLFNHLKVMLDAQNEMKFLTMRGLVGDQTDLAPLKKIPCFFISTAHGGSCLIAGFCLMIRERALGFDDMAPKKITPDDPDFQQLKEEGVVELLSRYGDILI